MNQKILQAWHKGFSKIDRQEIWEWAGSHVTLPNSYAIPGSFSVSRSKYMLEPLRKLNDYTTRQVILQCAVQTGKSLLADLYVPYVITNNPGNILLLHQDDDLSKKYVTSRLIPIINRCESARNKLSLEKHSNTKTFLHFSDDTYLFCGGANLNNVQSLSSRYILCDEAWLYKEGILYQAIQRAAAFPHTSKVFIYSQAGDEDSDLNNKWKEGNQCEWGWYCPNCNHLQPYEWNIQRPDQTWAGIVWDKDDTKSLHEIAKTARLSCFNCKHEVIDNVKNRRMLNDGGAYIENNPKAPNEIKSYRWNSLANIDVPFSSLVIDYLLAKQAEHDFGYFTPLKEFYQKKLAKPWNSNFTRVISQIATEAYDINSTWENEANRFLTVDCQKDLTLFYVVVRAWSKDGESRKLWHGRCETFEQIYEKQKEFKVRDQCVFLDSAYETQTVYQECAKHGHMSTVNNRKMFLCWNALKGSDSEDFLHNEGRLKDRRLYAPTRYVDPFTGLKNIGSIRVPLHLWSNPTVKDIFKRLRDGKGKKWLSNSNDDKEYQESLSSEVKRPVKNKTTGKLELKYIEVSDNTHYKDCELMNIAASFITKTVSLHTAQADNTAK